MIDTLIYSYFSLTYQIPFINEIDRGNYHLLAVSNIYMFSYLCPRAIEENE